jgi:hypothetical protein
MAGTWCDEARVLELTGITVTAEQLARAQGVLETYVDVDPADPGDISDRDRERLAKALAYQAGWMFEPVGGKIDAFTHTDVTQVSQDGLSFTYAHPDAAELAPLASRNIDRLSWNSSGPVGGGKLRKRYDDLNAVRDAVLADEVQTQPWVFEAPGL